MNKNSQNIDDSILAKYLSGEADESEIDAVLDWVSSSDDNIEKFEKFQKIWSLTNTKKQVDADKALYKLNIRLTKHRNIRWLYSAAAAAIIIFIVVITQIINTKTSNNVPQYAIATSETPVDTILPDGSNIILSENSTIEYSHDSLSNKRIANLAGKAFFNIKRDTTQKFIVNTQFGGVEVLGTQFNVNMLQNSDVQVDVLSGKVKLFLPQTSGDTLYLVITDNETAIISMQGNNIIKQPQEPSAFYSINKTIVFRNMDLATIFKELEKCYSVEIDVDSSIDNTLKFTSSFKDNTLDEILVIVTQTHELSFSKKGGIYTIKPDEE